MSAAAVAADLRGGQIGQKTLRAEFDASGLERRDRDAFYAGAAVAFEMYDAARDLKVPLSIEVGMIDALREEIAAYAEGAS